MKRLEIPETPYAGGLTRRSAHRLLALLAGALALPTSMVKVVWAKQPEGKFQQIADGIFAHHGLHELMNSDNHGDIANTGFIIGEESVAVIDTGGSFHTGTALRNAVRAATAKPIRYVINTHMHPDHVLGNAAFTPDQPRFVSHAKMARALSARGTRYLEAAKEAMGEEAFRGTEIVLPTEGVREPTTLDLGGRKLKLTPKPTAHTDNDLIIVDEKTQTAFVGDLIFSGHIPTLDGSILGWVQVLKEVDKQPPQLIVPGHGPASMGWAAAYGPMLRYLDTVIEDVRKIIAEGGTINDAIKTAGPQEAPRWELFDEFHQRNVTAAFAELEWE